MDLRIGKDFTVQWSIYRKTAEGREEYNLDGKKLVLRLQNAYKTEDVTNFIVNGNVVEWTFYGKDQRSTGSYNLILIENQNKVGMVTVDKVKAFTLVAHTELESGNSEGDVNIQTISLESVSTIASHINGIVDDEFNPESDNAISNKAVTQAFIEVAEDLRGKQEIINDLADIRTGAAKGATALQSIPSEYVTETELNTKVAGKQDALVSGSNIKTINGESVLGEGNIVIKGGTDVDTSKFATKEEVNAKQDIISDLATIRSNALKGATALQSVPSEYVTESELSAKGYATTSQVNAKQDKINDLADIRTGAAKGATAIQEVKTINGQSIIGEGNIEIEAYNDAEIKAQIANKQDILISNINIKTINGESVLGSGNIAINVDTSTLATKIELQNLSTSLDEQIATKQDALVSSKNIKTINGKSVLGNGNLDVSVVVDTAFSETSENPLQNKVITPVLAAKADVTYVDSAIAAAITNVLNTEV